MNQFLGFLGFLKALELIELRRSKQVSRRCWAPPCARSRRLEPWGSPGGALGGGAWGTGRTVQVHMLRSKYTEALKVAEEASQLFKSNGFMRNQVQPGFFHGQICLRAGGSSMAKCFHIARWPRKPSVLFLGEIIQPLVLGRAVESGLPKNTGGPQNPLLYHPFLYETPFLDNPQVMSHSHQ